MPLNLERLTIYGGELTGMMKEQSDQGLLFAILSAHFGYNPQIL